MRIRTPLTHSSLTSPKTMMFQGNRTESVELLTAGCVVLICLPVRTVEACNDLLHMIPVSSEAVMAATNSDRLCNGQARSRGPTALPYDLERPSYRAWDLAHDAEA